jgi:hypothetical protein
MPTQVQVATVADQIIGLADDYARSIISTALNPAGLTAQDLQERVSGAMLIFLSDAMALATVAEALA